MEIPQNLKIELPCDPAIPLLHVYPKEFKAESQRYLDTDIHGSIILSSQEVESKPNVRKEMNG